ncbi:MAG: hypothetical protein HQM16_13340 [Deltaproteobacteria bacterium]|nr:hypothetical protein [Deltaproteobacteria bacterium]
MRKGKIIAFLLLVMLCNACSTFYGGATNSEGNQSISNMPAEMLFEAEVGTTVYQSVSFTNRTDGNYEITSLALVDNVCGAFSVYNITGEADEVIYSTGEDKTVIVMPKETVSINIRFSPTPCERTQYVTTFIISYTDSNDVEASKTLNFTASVIDNTPPVAACAATSALTYYDEYTNPTIRSLPPLPDGKLYYLKVEKMSAYIQPTESFSQFATEVGTHINLENIPPDQRYKPVYVPLFTDDAGTVTITTIDECVGFVMPSPVTDNFFIGASIAVTTDSQFAGTVIRDDDPATGKVEAGGLTIPNMQFNLYSYINNSNSLLQSADGFFEINIKIDLTTGETASNPLLIELKDLTDDDGAKLLSIVDDKLVGKNVRHGTVRLVGIGQFLDDEAAKLSNEGKTGLFDGDAYMFLQIDGIITQEIEAQ